MLTQNLFSKKPKTFMDYEPGKLPSKKDRDTQTKAETKNYAPFASNVKIVGDNVTKKTMMISLKGSMTHTEKKENKNGSGKNRSEKKGLPISVQTPIIKTGILRVRMTRFLKVLMEF